MPRYLPKDDGSVVEGKTVVYLGLTDTSGAGRSAAERGNEAVLQAALAKATAAGLLAAARDGTPFCEACERARLERSGA